jgi:uncharacterized RDD family membrane protein YckC
MSDTKYAELIDRIKATFTDGIVSVGQIFLITNIFSSIDDVPTYARIAAFIGIFGLCEPLFVSLFGGTIGHFINGLRVKRDDNIQKNIAFPLAIVRYTLKVFLGIISLFTVSSNVKNKALHDLAVNSVVLKVK